MIVASCESDHERMVEIWWSSVQATHHFISPDYLCKLHDLLPSYLTTLHTFIYKDDADGEPVAFMGLSKNGTKLELLFVHPEHARKGIGTKLLQHAIKMDVTDVDSFEANSEAIKFYASRGFQVIGRSEAHSVGGPYPLIHLSLKHEYCNISFL